MVKVVKNFIFIVLSFIVLIPSTFAFELCEVSDEYKRWRALSEEERNNSIEPPYCKSRIKDQYSAKAILDSNNYGELDINERYDLELKASVSQSRYNAVDDGLVTSVKDQKSTNLCWAFTSNSLIETAAIKEGLGTYDLSERHIEYAVTRNGFTDSIKTNGFNRNIDDGGNSYYSSTYYFRHEGPLNESSMPFVNSISKISIGSLPQTGAILDVDTFNIEYFSTNTACTTNQIAAIKQRIVNYGSAGASMYYSNNYLNSGKYFYYNGTATSNHAVTIVGWDDSISASNFKSSPSTNGAWIVKNSWGTSFGDGGYLYISYGDTKICGNSYNFSGVSKNSYNYTYSASDLMSSFSISLGPALHYSSAKFVKQSKNQEILDKVSLEVGAGNAYAVYLSKSNTLSSQSDWQLLGSGTATYDGIVSVRFSPITIAGDYTIIVKRTGSGYYIPLMCKSTDYASKYYYANINSGINYYSSDGKTWTDYGTVSTEQISGCAPVIYAYTKATSTASASFEISNITGNNSVVYAGTGDYYTAYITSSGIQSFSSFGINILNSSGKDVTGNFKITNNLSNGNVRLTPNDMDAGTYTLKLSYGSIVKTKTFVISKLYTSSLYHLENGVIVVNAKTSNKMTKAIFDKNISFGSLTYKIQSSKGIELTNTSDLVGTDYRVIVGGRTLYVALIGDITGDGKIMSNDSLQISRYLVDLRTLTGSYKLAADVSGDGLIRSNDSLLISRFLVGLRGSL